MITIILFFLISLLISYYISKRVWLSLSIAAGLTLVYFVTVGVLIGQYAERDAIIETGRVEMIVRDNKQATFLGQGFDMTMKMRNGNIHFIPDQPPGTAYMETLTRTYPIKKKGALELFFPVDLNEGVEKPFVSIHVPPGVRVDTCLYCQD